MPGFSGLSNHNCERRRRFATFARVSAIVSSREICFGPIHAPKVPAKSTGGTIGEYAMQTVPAFDHIGEENAFAVPARATEPAAKGRDLINLGIGQPDLSTPKHMLEAPNKARKD